MSLNPTNKYHKPSPTPSPSKEYQFLFPKHPYFPLRPLNPPNITLPPILDTQLLPLINTAKPKVNEWPSIRLNQASRITVDIGTVFATALAASSCRVWFVGPICFSVAATEVDESCCVDGGEGGEEGEEGGCVVHI